jgi:hypothetical protein
MFFSGKTAAMVCLLAPFMWGCEYMGEPYVGTFDKNPWTIEDRLAEVKTGNSDFDNSTRELRRHDLEQKFLYQHPRGPSRSVRTAITEYVATAGGTPPDWGKVFNETGAPQTAEPGSGASFTVEGAAAFPKSYPWQSGITLAQALDMADTGPSGEKHRPADAAYEFVVIITPGDPRPSFRQVDARALVQGDRRADVAIYPGQIVFIASWERPEVQRRLKELLGNQP